MTKIKYLYLDQLTKKYIKTNQRKQTTEKQMEDFFIHINQIGFQ